MPLQALAESLGKKLEEKKLLLATAESCTGGWLAQVITSIAGSSAWFERGFVTYSNAAKQEMLGVSHAILNQYGAVSEQTAKAMSAGALQHSHAQLSIAITGIAGPQGGSPEKPVGTVWFAWASTYFPAAVAQCHQFQGDREAIRLQAVEFALKKLIQEIDQIII